MSKILILSDLHIRNYNNHNIDDPEFRLGQYLTLARDVKEFAMRWSIKKFIIAGDIFDNSTPSTLELDYFNRFIGIIVSGYYPPAVIHIIHGNHDFESKTSTSSKHAFLKPICDISKNSLQYHHNEDVEIFGKKFHFRGWEPKFRPIPECDVFIGHLYVNGATIAAGNSEFKVKGAKIEGLDNCKVAIIGDIHHDQWVKKIYIPGVSIQNSFSDPVDCHFSVLDTSIDLTSADCIQKYCLNEKQYLKFKYSDEESTNPLVIHKPFPRKINFTDPLKIEDLVDIKPMEILENLLEDSPHKDEVISCLSKEVSGDNTIAAEFKFLIKSIRIENFISIKYFQKEFTEKDKFLIFQGENGAGKSSIVKSIVWALKESLIYSRGKEKDCIHNDEEYASVTLEIEYAGSLYKIIRERGNKPSLRVWVNGADDVIVGHNVSMTQERLETALPIITRLSLLYFYQARDGLLSELSDSNRVSLISELSGQTSVVEYSKDIEKLVTELEEELYVIDAKLSIKENTCKTLESTLVEIEDPSPTIKTIEDGLSAIQTLKDNLSIEKRAVRDKIGKLHEGEIDQLEADLKSLSEAKEKLYEDSNSLKLEVSKNFNILQIKENNKCPTCGNVKINDDFNKALFDKVMIKSEEDNKEHDLIVKKFKKISDFHVQMDTTQRRKLHVNLERDIKEASFELDSKLTKLHENQNSLNIKLGELKQKFIQYQEYLISKNKFSLAESEYKEVYKYHESKENKFSEIKGIKNTIFGQNGLLAAAILEKVANQMNTDKDIKIITHKIQKNGKVKPTLNIQMKLDEIWRDYDTLSGGEKLLADIILVNKMIDIVGGVGFMIFDESFKYFGKKFTRKALEILSESKIANIFLIFHGELPLDISFERVDVTRENSESRYTFNYK